MSIHIGTSGWHYPHWVGHFYPAELHSRDWLAHYARQFDCVEINNSFYRLPTVANVDHWLAQTPEGFTFTLKASRYITHMKKLHDCAAPLAELLPHMFAFAAERSRTGDPVAENQALLSIRKALEEGFRNRDKFHTDPDFAALQDNAEFQQLMAMEPRVL